MTTNKIWNFSKLALETQQACVNVKTLYANDIETSTEVQNEEDSSGPSKSLQNIMVVD